MGRGKFQLISKETFTKRPPDAIAERLRELRVDREALLVSDNWRGGRGIGRPIGAKSFIAYSNDAERSIGTKVYLACGGHMDLSFVLNAYEDLLQAGAIR